MKVAFSLCLLALAFGLNEASPIYPHVGGPGPVVVQPAYGPGYPGYGHPALQHPLAQGPGPYAPGPYAPGPYAPGPYAPRPYIVPSQSFDRQNVGASSQSWNSGGNSAYDNLQQSTDGGANQDVTSDKSGDDYYQGDDRRSQSRHDNERGNDGNGEYARNFDDDNASWDRDDNNNGFAQSDADISRGFGRSRSVTSRGSQHKDNRNDRQRSTNTADDQYSNGPGGVHQSNFRNRGASSRRNHDRGVDAFDNGDQYNDFGRNRDRWSKGSSAIDHRGDGGSSFQTDSNDFDNDRYGTRSRNFHDDGSSADAADISAKKAHDSYDGGRDWNRDTRKTDRTSQSGSALTNDARHRLTDDVRNSADARGVHSSHNFANDASRDNIANDIYGASENVDDSEDFGRNKKITSRDSNAKQTAVDSTASSQGLSTAAGIDQFGQYSTASKKDDASTRQTVEGARAAKDRGQISTGFGFNQAVYDKASAAHNSRGTVASSNNDKSTGAKIGRI